MFFLDKLIFSALWNFCNLEGIPCGLFMILGFIATAIPPYGKKDKK